MYSEINEKNLKLSIYEYFKYCKSRKIRGVGVITDKQCVFYSQVIEKQNESHSDILFKLENEIHPNDKKNGWDAYRDNHVYLFSLGKELGIDLPLNKELSKSQAQFLFEILDQVELYNNEQYDKNDFINVLIFGSKVITNNPNRDINIIRKIISQNITQHSKLNEEEKIIGNILSKETFIKM